jgi:hypothetical protein
MTDSFTKREKRKRNKLEINDIRLSDFKNFMKKKYDDNTNEVARRSLNELNTATASTLRGRRRNTKPAIRDGENIFFLVKNDSHILRTRNELKQWNKILVK